MSTKEKLEERKFILECIKLYETLPALWNTKSKDYANRDKKNQQYQTLLRKYKERFVNADKTDLMRKFNSLRTNFRKELKKVRDSKKSIRMEDVCEPTLWYFEQMKFLINTDDLSPYQNIMSDESELNEVEEVELKGTEPKLKKKKNSNATDELVRLATERLRNPQDPSQQIGIVWASKLMKMDRNQRIIAEKIINEIMFNGELGLLNFNTTLANLSSTNELNPSSSSFNKNGSSESLLESTPINNYTVKYDPSPTPTEIIRQRFSTDRLNYSSPSPPLVNTESITDHENIQATQSFVVAEYNLLDNSIKMEE